MGKTKQRGVGGTAEGQKFGDGGKRGQGGVIAEDSESLVMGRGEREHSVPSDHALCTLYFGGFGGRCAVILAGTRC